VVTSILIFYNWLLIQVVLLVGGHKPVTPRSPIFHTDIEYLDMSGYHVPNKTHLDETSDRIPGAIFELAKKIRTLISELPLLIH
jgi:hypothetical protein